MSSLISCEIVVSQICFCINDYFPILVFIWFSKKHVIMSMFDVLTPVHSKYCVYIFTTLNNVSCFGSINLWICLFRAIPLFACVCELNFLLPPWISKGRNGAWSVDKLLDKQGRFWRGGTTRAQHWLSGRYLFLWIDESNIWCYPKKHVISLCTKHEDRGNWLSPFVYRI